VTNPTRKPWRLSLRFNMGFCYRVPAVRTTLNVVRKNCRDEGVLMRPLPA
jgi:hypothetical protein